MDKESIMFKHQLIKINNVSVHLIQAGNPDKQTILFLHGYPENWLEFKPLMTILKDDYNLLAVDLPGIGKSEKLETSDKYTLAKFFNNLIHQLKLKDVVIVGHDIGGMIAYSLLKNFPETLAKVIIIATAIPGVNPWEEVKRNPYLWHFAFYAIPNLPELLITGKERDLFDYYFDNLSFVKDISPEDIRQEYTYAYSQPSSLKTSLDWYRSFKQDENDNINNMSINTPLLYIKGDKDYGCINEYVEGFKRNGIKQVKGKLITDSAHFIPEEQPQALSEVINEFIINN